MKLNDYVSLDVSEQEILYCWGCPSYKDTLVRLITLEEITVDPDTKEAVSGLWTKLLLFSDAERYKQLFYLNRLQKGVKADASDKV